MRWRHSTTTGTLIVTLPAANALKKPWSGYADYPDDPEAAIFYALALNGAAKALQTPPSAGNGKPGHC